MNQRLLQEYQRLRTWGEESFQSGDIYVDTNFGSACFGVTVQIPISDVIIPDIQKIQEELQAIAGGELLIQEAPTLHITVDPVILWSSNPDEMAKNQAHWNAIEKQCRLQFQSFSERFQAIPIVFRECITVKNAIFLGAYDDHDAFAEVRAAVRTELGAPAETTFRNTVIHCVIARYRDANLPTQELLSYTKQPMKPLPMNINRVQLRKELRYPAQEIEIVEEIVLPRKIDKEG